jgi:hypothetical protein
VFLSFFKWNLYKCSCWLIIEVILRNAMCNSKAYRYNSKILQVPTNTAGKLVVDVPPERISGLLCYDVDIPGHVPSMVVGLCLKNCKAVVNVRGLAEVQSRHCTRGAEKNRRNVWRR